MYGSKSELFYHILWSFLLEFDEYLVISAFLTFQQLSQNQALVAPKYVFSRLNIIHLKYIQ